MALAYLGGELEKCVGSRVHLVGVSIAFKKNFYRLPFTPPSLVRRIGPSITFGDNGCGRVLSEGEIKVSDKITFNRLDTICFLCPSCWMRALRCCFNVVVLVFWTLEGTLFV
jgi:hypothetical protein